MKRFVKFIGCLMAVVPVFTFVGLSSNSNVPSKNEESTPIISITTDPVPVNTHKIDISEKTYTPVQAKPTVAKLLSEDEIYLIAICTMGEAEGEPDLGKRLVIDTILNRVDCEDFPDNVTDVIYQPNAFECMWNGRVETCVNSSNYMKMMNDISQLIKEELLNRKNEDVTYFCAGGFSDYGTPLFQVGNHYFSSN